MGSSSAVWGELSGHDPALVTKCRPTLVSIVALGVDLLPVACGTGFIIGVGGDHLLALTAQHVLEHAAVVQHPPMGLRPSPVPGLIAEHRPDLLLDPRRLMALWSGERSASVLQVVETTTNSATDIAACLLRIGASLEDREIKAAGWPCHFTMPSVGQAVQLIALGMDVTTAAREIRPPLDASGKGQRISFTNAVRIRVGTVTGVHTDGYGRHRYPCFTTNIPVEPGMSGGLVLLKDDTSDGLPMGVCGVVCADDSSTEAFGSQWIAGNSIISCIWPSVGLPRGDQTLLDCFASGELMAIGGINHLKVERIGSEVTVRYQNQN